MEKAARNPATERLGMLDEHGHRQFIIPAEVRGFYHKWKKRVHFVLMLIFVALPWIYINGHQAILLDLPRRQFFFFGAHFMASDAPLVFFLLVIATIGLALMTALMGRVWCGWACPQTVFIESIYRQIERWTEGNYIERRKLQKEDWSLRKIRKTGLKWILFFLVSSLIAHSFVAYWTGSKELLAMIEGSPSENFSYFMMVSIMTGVLLFNFGWFREQFCLIMCPYGKFQSVLMDSQSVTVMYDNARGEPRKGAGLPGEAKGDCVSCNRCVQVCPTGIDIRNGIQMECIACTACVDACDEIMTKVKKPTGLIRYKALKDGPVQWLRPRVVAYGALLLASTVALVALLAMHQSVRVEVLRGKDMPFAVRPEGDNKIVQNHFTLRLENQASEEQTLEVSVNRKNVKLILPENPVIVKAGEKKDLPLFLEVSQNEMTSQNYLVKVSVESEESHQIVEEKNVSILGPQGIGVH